MLETIVIIVLIVLDQVVKYLVKTGIPLGTSVPLIPGVMGLTYLRNDGAAFSMLVGARWFFVVLTVAFLVFALWVLYTKKLLHPFGKWAWVLVIAGAAGNLIDRALYGYVVDMFQTLFMNFAIFNVADIFVVVGGIAFCIYYAFLHDRLKAAQKPAADAEAEAQEEPDGNSL